MAVYIYIGQSINILIRFAKYKTLHCKGQSKLYNSFKSHGVNKHKFEIICECDENVLNKLEAYYIKIHNSFNSDFGMNLTSGGGRLNSKVSEETKLKISKKNKGKWCWCKGKKIHSLEFKRNMSNRHSKKCIHLESGMEFNSLKELCKTFNLKRTTQVEANRLNRKSLKFKYV